ncbi:major facilitator superfamily domain-containing protein [Ilyonectria robusta]|uniref:major facilitator superfamily domain-containing protein n=1 Tax=Ilyonectria robusta TaxID=1079257 RepID=UPI001E8ED00A|nr:major facilitator superfamily domain-containing protein [Ilyonectria robusta]KAH8688412.1 major facilitator superfamily domain-containing protein [Ilyonectria robusta]
MSATADFDGDRLSKKETAATVADKLSKKETLGNVQLRHHETNEIILVPTPTSDPNDPLNWSKAYRLYIAGLVSVTIFLSNFLAAGPSVAIVEIAMDFFGDSDLGLSGSIAKVSYFFTTTALLQGMGNLIWMPVMIKYGRRPLYIFTFALYTATAGWAGAPTSYGSVLAARILMGFANGAAECLAPLTISDIFFLHERGTIMALYTASLSAGVGGGIVIAGLITIHLHWRYIYYISTALIGACTILIFFTLPETQYRRAAANAAAEARSDKLSAPAKNEDDAEVAYSEVASQQEADIPKRRTWVQELRIFTGTYTNESVLKLIIRPVVLLALPPVLWATLVMSVTIGFLVAITSNFSSAFQTVYGFKAYQAGLCFIASIISSLIGVFFGGHLGDMVADYFTKRNGGIREPEMRLPAMMISLVTGPLALVLYGVGIGKTLHWIVPTIGLGLLNFSIVQATNISLVYTIDAYRPVAGEVTVSQFAFKSAFGFLLSFYTNPWIAKSGYVTAFGSMAGISAAVISFWVVFYFFGKRIRHATWEWGFVEKLVHWHDDREVGE